MDNLHASVSYQRAVAPILNSSHVQDSNSMSSQFHGKTQYNQQATVKRPTSVRTSVISSKVPSAISPDSQRSGQYMRTFVSLNGGPVTGTTGYPTNTISASPSKVMQRGGIGGMNGAGTFSLDLNLQGKAVSPVHQASSSAGKFNHMQQESASSSTNSSSRYDLIPISNEFPADGIIFARSKNKPDSIFVYRTDEERSSNPERLNLDRRHLDACPIVEQEDRLRLLNLQSNNIKAIQHIEHLPNLIFLDLYNNKINSLEGALSSCRGLRVLMLGKNKISTISNISHMIKIDVLDLHSNDIHDIQGLDNLCDLRVLNLAGNKISSVKNLHSLSSLTELNLRRNHIECVYDLDQLPSLQRIFLSHNLIANVSVMKCLFNMKVLVELTIDENPVSSRDMIRFRQFMIIAIPTLSSLDLKAITADDIAAAKLVYDHEAVSSIIMKPVSSNDVVEVRKSLDHHIMMNSTSHDAAVDNVDIHIPSHHHMKLSPLKAVRQGKLPLESGLFAIEDHISSSSSKALIIADRMSDWFSNKASLADVVELSICRIRNDIIASSLPSNISSLLPNLTILRLIQNNIKSIADLEAINTLFVETIREVEVYDSIIIAPDKPPSSLLMSYFKVKIPNLKLLNKLSLDDIDIHHSHTLIDPMLLICQAKVAGQSQLKSKSSASMNKTSINTVGQMNSISSKSRPQDVKGPDTVTFAQGVVDDITQTNLRQSRLRLSFSEAFDEVVEGIVMKAIGNKDR